MRKSQIKARRTSQQKQKQQQKQSQIIATTRTRASGQRNFSAADELYLPYLCEPNTHTHNTCGQGGPGQASSGKKYNKKNKNTIYERKKKNKRKQN